MSQYCQVLVPGIDRAGDVKELRAFAKSLGAYCATYSRAANLFSFELKNTIWGPGKSCDEFYAKFMKLNIHRYYPQEVLIGPESDPWFQPSDAGKICCHINRMEADEEIVGYKRRAEIAERQLDSLKASMQQEINERTLKAIDMWKPSFLDKLLSKVGIK